MQRIGKFQMRKILTSEKLHIFDMYKQANVCPPAFSFFLNYMNYDKTGKVSLVPGENCLYEEINIRDACLYKLDSVGAWTMTKFKIRKKWQKKKNEKNWSEDYIRTTCSCLSSDHTMYPQSIHLDNIQPWKMASSKCGKKMTKIGQRIISKPHAHRQTMTKWQKRL